MGVEILPIKRCLSGVFRISLVNKIGIKLYPQDKAKDIVRNIFGIDVTCISGFWCDRLVAM